jgi:hypothetical protein
VKEAKDVEYMRKEEAVGIKTKMPDLLARTRRHSLQATEKGEEVLVERRSIMPGSPEGQDLFVKFKRAIQISQRIEMGSLATMLGIPKEQLLAFLLDWSEQVHFKIDKDLIIVQDINETIMDLDKEFAAWDGKEKSKEGKK